MNDSFSKEHEGNKNFIIRFTTFLVAFIFVLLMITVFFMNVVKIYNNNNTNNHVDSYSYELSKLGKEAVEINRKEYIKSNNSEEKTLIDSKTFTFNKKNVENIYLSNRKIDLKLKTKAFSETLFFDNDEEAAVFYKKLKDNIYSKNEKGNVSNGK